MKYTSALLFAAFLIGISVSDAAAKDRKSGEKTRAKGTFENEDSIVDGSSAAAPVEDPRSNPNEASPELKSQIALMESIKIKAAAIHPANLIAAVLKTPEDRLISALPTLHQLTELLEGTPLGTFLHNLEIVATDSNPYLWYSVIESYPDFVGSITEAGGKLAGLASAEADQLTIFNEKELGLNDLFPVADHFSEVDSFSRPEQDELEIDDILSDDVGQIAAALRKL